MSEEQRLGRYIIEEQLGEGSFAWVYRGYDEELDRRVAVKVLKPIWLSDMSAVTRFKTEARTMAKLDHSNIAVVYEVGEAEGQVFLAQRLVEGGTLADQMGETGTLPWPDALEILRQVASALDYAHSEGMIHRDIKPANILVDDKGRAFLGDFGLVRAAEGSASISASAGGMVGTPAYMAPEQWKNEEITPATDVYALSCVVFEMLTGHMLFDAENPASVMTQHVLEGPKFPDTWPEDVPEQVVEVLKRGLASSAAERISSAGELVDELGKAEQGLVEAAPLPEAEPTPTPSPTASTVTTPAAPAAKKSGAPVMAIIGVVVVLIIVGVGGFFIFGGGGDGTEPSSEAQSGGVAAVPADEEEPTDEPTEEPTEAPTEAPTEEPTPEPPTATPEPEEAEPAEAEADEAEPDFDEVVSRAEAFFEEGDFQKAIEAYGQAIELEPNDDYLYNQRGIAYLELGELELALAEFDQAIALNPNDGNLHWNRAWTYDTLGNHQEALASYAEAIAAFQAAGEDEEYYGEIEVRIAELEAELGESVVEAEPTEEPAEEPTEAPVAEEPAATPEPVADISGHIAIPLMVGNEPSVFVTDTNGNQVNVLDSARQPTHTLDGSQLMVNGDGGSQVLLRMAGSNGSSAQEFGNPTLSSHSHPAWSPDGNSVVYLDRFGTEEYHMFVRDIDSTEGEGEELFATGNGAIFHANPMYPQWSNSGIVFRGCSTWTGQGGDCGTWLLTEQQGSASKITGDANHIPTDVSGNTAVFSWNQGNWDVYAVDIQSGNITRLTNDPAQDALGTISPDGNSVAFLSNRGGGLAVWYVSIEGGVAEKMFDIPSGWGALRGDGWSEETLSWGQ